MKMKYILPIAALVFVCTDATAQMNNVVDVENSYIPVVKDANKIDITPETQETPVKHYAVEYATNSLPVRTYAFQPMWAAQSDAAINGAKKGFVSLGGGNAGNLQARGAYGIEFTSDDRLNITIGMDGHNGNVWSDNEFDKEWKSRFYSTRAGVGYVHQLTQESAIAVGAAFESQVFNYRQNFLSGGLVNDGLSCDKQHNTLGDLTVGVSPYKFDRFSIGGQLEYHFFKQKYATSQSDECSEGIFAGKVDLAYDIDPNNKIGVGVALRSASYNMKYDYGFFTNEGRDFKSNTSFHLSPGYDMRNENLDLHIGMLLCGTSGIQSKFRIAPDVRLNLHINQQTDVYAEATGGEVYNDFRHFAQLTPYWGFADALSANVGIPVQLPNQFDQLCATAGVRLEAAKGLSADIYAGYDISKGRAELATPSVDGNNVYRLFTADGNRLRLNIDLRYNYKDIVGVSMKNRVNSWQKVDSPYSEGKTEIYWHPIIDLDWYASLRMIPELQIGLGYKLQTFKKPDAMTNIHKRPMTSNLCADMSYTFKSGLSLFVRGDNLLGGEYENYWGYGALGTNFLAGFALTF